MVYAGAKDNRNVTLGVSGRLRNRNLVMWDEETNSLWSQILGEGLTGESKGVVLDMLPAVFVGLGTWKRLHPETRVLDLSTVQQRGWFYTSGDLARGHVENRGGRDVLGIGLRHGGETLCVAMPMLHEKGVVEVEVGDVPLAVVWHDGEAAALVYDRRVGGRTVEVVLSDGVLQATGGGGSWNPLTGAATGEAPPLLRFPYLPTYLRAWKSYYKDGAILQ